VKLKIRNALVRQFSRPTGLLGRLVGLIMATRPSNLERNMRTVAQVDIQPDDRILEIGFGPGIAIERAAELAKRGKVIGVDHSALMLRQASRRNATAIAKGRVDLRLGTAESLPEFAEPFDKVIAINSYMFWNDPDGILLGLRNRMRPGGVIALTFQSRQRAATNEDTQRGAEAIAASLQRAGFEKVRIETFEMKPVNAACVLAQAP
jgi:ubiquinone/menaquinone biosynthesis C-methylase UbiE